MKKELCVLDAKWDLSNAKCDDQVFPEGFVCSQSKLGGKNGEKGQWHV